MSLTAHTSLGDLKFELYCEDCPKACENFLALAGSGAYDSTTFHRCMKGFIVQGGDPTGKGKGGESCWGGYFQDEIHNHLRHSTRGMLSMANRKGQADTNGSQFFITFCKQPHLNGVNTVFGKVIHGLDVLDVIERAAVDSKYRPTINIVIKSFTIHSNPIADSAREVALMTASSKIKIAELLIEHGADVNLRDKQGRHPLAGAVSNSSHYSTDIVRIICSKDVDVMELKALIISLCTHNDDGDRDMNREKIEIMMNALKRQGHSLESDGSESDRPRKKAVKKGAKRASKVVKQISSSDTSSDSSDSDDRPKKTTKKSAKKTPKKAAKKPARKSAKKPTSSSDSDSTDSEPPARKKAAKKTSKKGAKKPSGKKSK